jgi:hypothetical protein
MQLGQIWQSLRIKACSHQRWALRRLVGALLGGGAYLLYCLREIARDPLLAGWNAQNLTLSPPAWDLLISLSPAILLAVPGLVVAWRSGGSGGRLLALWSVIGLLLVYLPFGLQRRFMLGLYIPLAGLAVAGAWRFVSGTRRRGRWAFAVLFLISIPTNLLVLAAGLNGAQTRDPALYLSGGEKALMAWLAEATPAGAVVLAAPETGLLIPAHSGRRVLYGHPFESVPAGMRQSQVTGFYSGNSTSTDWDLLSQVDYVVYGPRERALAANGEQAASEGQPALEALSDLECVYASGGVEVYRVTPWLGR